jgi:hypothetical protein
MNEPSLSNDLEVSSRLAFRDEYKKARLFTEVTLRLMSSMTIFLSITSLITVDYKHNAFDSQL